MDNVRPFKDPSNTDILNAIRKNASPAYQARIPKATQGDVQDTLHGLLSNRPLMNEFVDALVNRIGMEIYRSQTWSNPLAKFKVGLLEYGNTIEEIVVGLLEAKQYSHDRDYLEKDIFGQETPNVQASYHKVNRENYYKLTVKEGVLKRAFLSPTGLSKFITSLMATPLTSDNWDEFLLMTSLFKEYDKAGGFFDVNVPNIAAITSDREDSNFVLRRLQEFAGNLAFPSAHYNAAGMNGVFANPNELELFLTPEADAAMNVESLANAFNIDKANFASRKTIIPKEHFGDSATQAILTTRDFFVVADQRLETTSAVNPVGLLTNYFLHHWQVISASRFVPAIRFTTGPGDVITISDPPVTGVTAITFADAEGTAVTAADIERGELYEVISEAVTTGENTAVRFEVTGNESPKTYVSNDRYLFVSEEESAETLTITAYAVGSDIPQLNATVEVTLNGAILQLWPDPQVIDEKEEEEGENPTP